MSKVSRGYEQINSSLTEIPEGYEKMELEWNVDPYQTAASLVFKHPAGWQFFRLIKEDDKAVITYIRNLSEKQIKGMS